MSNNLLKGGVFALIIWWFWFSQQKNAREYIIVTIISCFASMAFARGLALMLPMRDRPLYDTDLDFVIPFGVTTTGLEGWSSFPSDHAALFFTLAIGVFFISRRLGIFALIYTTLFICLPRIYLGLHFPTDIVAGAIIGIIIGWIGNLSFFRIRISKPVLNWANSYQNLFYTFFFLITYQIADLFNSSRAIAGAVFKFIKHIV